jgi:hypothetical protein
MIRKLFTVSVAVTTLGATAFGYHKWFSEILQRIPPLIGDAIQVLLAVGALSAIIEIEWRRFKSKKM